MITITDITKTYGAGGSGNRALNGYNCCAD